VDLVQDERGGRGDGQQDEGPSGRQHG
jgi:hypothetical protein